MSTVLERMIQRTRGPLSSLEPLATPTFAAVPLRGQGWADPADPPGEAPADGASTAARRQEPRPSGHPEQPPGERPAQRTEARSGRSRGRPVDDEHLVDLADSGQEPVPGVPARSDPVMPAPVMPGPGRPSRRRSTSRGQLGTANPHPSEDHREPGPDPVATPARRVGEEPNDARERDIPEMHVVPAVGPVRAASAGPEAVPAVGPVRAATAGLAAAPFKEPGAVRSAAVAVVEPGPVSARPLSVQPPHQRPASPRPSASPGQAADVFRGSGPEVTISIGHIEVHAAPAVEQPRSRPPFRPQVSLADFLSQDRHP